MHRTSEYGIAAHWRYKEGGGTNSDTQFEEKLSWMRQILEWQHDSLDATEFMETMKIDLFSDVVFVFTPKGDVVELPVGSCPVDFAYRIHTEVGNRCIGAKVSGKIVPIDYQLVNGDIVDVLTSKQGNGPSRDWLQFVKTPQARNRIKQWHKKEKREDNIIRGKELLEKEMKKIGADPNSFFKMDSIGRLCRRFSFNSEDDLYAGVGSGAVAASTVVVKVREELQKKETALQRLTPLVDEKKLLVKVSETQGRVTTTGIIVKGERNLAVNLAHCCNPLPGDQIIGYITRGRGVSVHRVDCPNVAYYFSDETERMVEVSWDLEAVKTYQVEVEVRAYDRPQLTWDVLDALAELKATVNSVHARAQKNKMAMINLKLEIRDLEHLYTIMQKISRVSDVLEVHRVVP
jgi:GTP pyrophosphokinase